MDKGKKTKSNLIRTKPLCIYCQTLDINKCEKAIRDITTILSDECICSPLFQCAMTQIDRNDVWWNLDS